MKKIVFFVLMTFMALPVIAGEKSPCHREKKIYCSQVLKGDHDGMLACLKRNKRNLSDACSAHVDNLVERNKKTKARQQDHIVECTSEEKRYCKDVTPGNGRVKACLRLHKEKLSNGCREALKRKSLFY